MASFAPSARARALALLTSILAERRTLDEALPAHPFKGSEADAQFSLLLTLTVLRHLGQIDVLLARYLVKPLPAKRRAVSLALRLGIAQLLILETPAHAAVNETVALLKKGKDTGLAGLVNAVLQKIAREKPVLPLTVHNLPEWLQQRWSGWYGPAAMLAIAEVASGRPPLDLHTKVEIAGAVRLDAQMVRLPAEHAPVETLAGYKEGTFFVQDLAASYPARLLGDVRGKRVLDLCAAPGGKTAQLAWAGAHVTALDRSPARLTRLQENMARLALPVETIVADALEWKPAAPYDAILLDAPCSATGTWRRHPEVVQLVTPQDILELSALQRQLLTRAWGWLKPGGKLVYCVCSLEREEGEAQAAWFLEMQKEASLIAPDGTTAIFPQAITHEGYVRTLPSFLAEQGSMDGFFAVGFEKR
jgi:16S rRNA (cytosine967-C5)-methyltransferase